MFTNLTAQTKRLVLGAIVTATVLFVGFSVATPAQAQTRAQLEAEIQALLLQIQQLQVALQTGVPSATVCPYRWDRNLTIGMTGADVMRLQQFLNSSPDTRLATFGAGAPGFETQYYGPITADAVARFQAKHRADVLTPLGLVNPTGFFGPSSRAQANDLCAVAPAPPDVDDDADEDEDEDDDRDERELSGEGSLRTFEVDDEEDEVAEGAEDEVVLVITAEARDGDLRLDRMDFSIVADAGNSEDDPWDVFDEFTLWVDGDRIARFEADDEDEYLDEDDGEFRFTNLDLILEEDEEVEIEVAVSVAGSVDDADESEDWTLDVTDLRYFDADGVATNDDDTDELDDGGYTFRIVEEGSDDDADLESSSDNPDATTFIVEDNTSESDDYLVHVFDIEVDEDSSDLELDDAYATVMMTNPAGAGSAITADDVISEITMIIDGEEVDGEVVTDGDDEDSITAGNDDEVYYRFDFDGLILESGEDYEVEIVMIFEGQDDGDAYENGVQIETDVDGSEWEVEGLSDDNVLSGTDSSETHTLATVAPIITNIDFSRERNDATTQGTISAVFSVEADGDDDVTLDVANNNDVDGSSDDIRFTLTGGGATATAVASLVILDGDATYSGGTWTIQDGDEATFALDVTFDGTDGAGVYRVRIDSIGGVEIDETSPGMVLSSS